MGYCFMCCYRKLTEAEEQNKDALKSAHDEIAASRHGLQLKMVELDERLTGEAATRHRGSTQQQPGQPAGRGTQDGTGY